MARENLAVKVYATKCFTFDSAHKLVNYDGKCANLHGHTYKMEVKVSRVIYLPSDKNNLASEYMVTDFKKLKKIVEEDVLKNLDHQYLNVYFEQPTAEVLASSIYFLLQESLPKDVNIESVKLWETPDSYAEFCGEYEYLGG